MDDIFDYEHPFVCTDAVLFTIRTEEPDNYRKLPVVKLKIPLYIRDATPFENKWCLPGGFLNIDELPEENIRRKLYAKTDIGNCWMEQLCTFCDLDRDPRARVISIAYLGLMNEAESRIFEKRTVWFTVETGKDKCLHIQNDECTLSEPDIGFDHYRMISIGLERLRSKILYSDIIFNLLPEEFTLTQLQNVYETILGRKDQAANFRRKIIGMVQETERYTGDKGHRPARIYTRKQRSWK